MTIIKGFSYCDQNDCCFPGHFLEGVLDLLIQSSNDLRLFLPSECSPLVSLDSHHPDALQKIQTLESEAAAKGKDAKVAADAPKASTAPSFTEHLADQKCTEGETVTLECKVVPIPGNDLPAVELTLRA